jgi:RNA polymerase sigma factor (sigma-70 family)
LRRNPLPIVLDDAEVDTVRANELALAYRSGQADLLPELFDAVRPILLTALARYGAEGRALPPSLELADVVQQSWLVLDSLARRWDPSGGDFPAYARSGFLWGLWRYVRTQSGRQRARDVEVEQVPHDDLLEQLREQPGTDGRIWERDLILAQMLDELDPLPRRALLLHLLGEQSFDQIGQALQIGTTGAYREYRRALERLRIESGLEVPAVDAAAGPGATGRPGDERALRRLVAALHEGADAEGRLPGRSWLRAHTGLSELRLAHLIGLLVERGCIEGRSARRAGRLVEATPEATLERAEGRR